MNPKRLKAGRAGKKRWIGLPCKKCGSRDKYVSTGGCLECGKNKSKKYYSEQKKLLVGE